MTPETFENALRLYDPALSLRWGHVVKAWVVERKCQITPQLLATLVDGMKKAIHWMNSPEVQEKDQYRLKKACEEGYSAGFGKRVIIYAKYLDNRVFDALRLTDLQAAGNMERAINASKNRVEEKKRDRYNAYEPLGREVESVIDFGLRKKSAEIPHDGGARLMAEAFGKEVPKGQHSVSSGPLVDGFGKPLIPPKKNVKLEIASA